MEILVFSSVLSVISVKKCNCVISVGKYLTLLLYTNREHLYITQISRNYAEIGFYQKACICFDVLSSAVVYAVGSGYLSDMLLL